MDIGTHQHRIVNHTKSEIPELCKYNKISKYRNPRHFQNFVPSNWFCYGIVIVLMLILSTMSTFGEEGKENDIEPNMIDWREGYEGHGTTHEQMGQHHWSSVVYTPYERKVNYSKKRFFPSFGMQSIFNLTHHLYDKILYGQTAISPGYITVQERSTLVLGPKVASNDWLALIGEHWMTIVIPFILLLIIILVPFIGVCYCCFCCCRKCTPGCPPCDRARDFQRCLVFAVMLIVIIILMFVFSLIAFMCNRILDRGLSESREDSRRDAENNCRFFEDIKEHVHHLFSKNYEEMENHVTAARKHIFMDFADTSEANALEEMERILEGLPAALPLMQELSELEKEYRLLGTQLRDGLRYVKRHMYLLTDFVEYPTYLLSVIEDKRISFLDTSNCLHLDAMPNTSVYIEGIKEIIRDKIVNIPKIGIDRFQNIQDIISQATNSIFPQLIRDVHNGRDNWLQNARRIQEIVETIVGNIFLNSLRRTRSLEDFYEKYDVHRSAVNMYICVLVFVIDVALSLALIFGCFVNRQIGAYLFFLAMILIFCSISIITLVGMFYFILGIVTYHGGCAKTEHLKIYQTVFEMSPLSDMLRFISPLTVDEDQDQTQAAMAVALAKCEAKETIFTLLTKQQIFDIDDLRKIEILRENPDISINTARDLTHELLISDENEQNLLSVIFGKLSSYHSVHFLENICLPLVTPKLSTLYEDIKVAAKAMAWTHTSYTLRTMDNIAFHVDSLEMDIEQPMKALQQKIKDKLSKLDKFLTYNNNEFGTSMHILLKAILKAQGFIRTRGKGYIHVLTKNLTRFIQSEVEDYVDMVIENCNKKVGLCQPISHIYFRSLDHICARLVDPLNGYWFGLIPCTFLMVPALVLCHYLMCLLKKHSFYSRRRDTVIISGQTCPRCVAPSELAPPLLISSVSHQRKLYKNKSKKRPGGGDTYNDVIILQDLPQSEVYNKNETDIDSLDSKRKRD